MALFAPEAYRCSSLNALLDSFVTQLTRRPPRLPRRPLHSQAHTPLGLLGRTAACYSHAYHFGAGKANSLSTVIYSYRHISTTATCQAPDPDQIVLSKSHGLTSIAKSQEFLSQLTEAQKLILFRTLNLEILRQQYEDGLGHHLTKFGRPTSFKDPNTPGTFTPVAPEWLQKKLASELEIAPPEVQPILQEEKSTPASLRDIWTVGLTNAIPFVGFGFLDNLIMILAGDYIDTRIGTAFAISTMAAAALGNTVSDVAGLASAWYVERVAQKVGIRQPELTAFQMASWQVRWVTNFGRALGVTLGCLLGMIPLLFLNAKGDDKEEEKEKNSSQNQSHKAVKAAAAE